MRILGENNLLTPSDVRAILRISSIEKGQIMRQVLLIPDPEGGYTVEVPSLPGCISEGDTIEEALTNIREAIELHIESMVAHGKEVPNDYSEPLQIMTV